MDAEPGARGELLAALRTADRCYDAAWCALSAAKTGPQYATRLRNGTPVHPTRESADYALALLDSGKAARTQRALGVLWRLVGEQDTDPASRTYGLWPWYYEEPLDQMAAPDFNWADFIGVRLAQVLLRHASTLAHQDAALLQAVRAALLHAGRSIQRRDVTLTYTNIAVMGCYVTVLAGGLLHDGELAGYGRDRLRRLAAFTDEIGGFAEYNSPVYTGVAITELTRMLRDFTDDGDRELVGSLLDAAWCEVALRWHRPTGQWAGPHLRSYTTVLTPGRGELDVLARGLHGRASLVWCDEPVAPTPALHRWDVPFRCPDELLPYFTDDTPHRDVTRRLPADGAEVTAFTRLRAGFALGIVDHGSLWMQGRPVLVYAASPTGPVAFRPRLLHDGRDYAPARVVTARRGDAVLVGVCVADDVGAHHPVLDAPEWAGRFRAADVRLRLEFLGVGAERLPAGPRFGPACRVAFGTTTSLGLRLLDAGFDGASARIETGPADGGGGAIDVVLYEGPSRLFELSRLRSFHALFAFEITDGADRPGELTDVHHRQADGWVEAGFGGQGRMLRFPAVPRPAAQLAVTAPRPTAEARPEGAP